MIFSCKIGAQAGAGVKVTGDMMSKCFSRGGFNVIGYAEYPSLVRGGHNMYEVLASDENISSPRQKCDIVIALNKDAVFYHKDFVKKGGIILYEDSIDIGNFKIPKGVRTLALPLKKLIDEGGGSAKMQNTVAMSCALAMVNYPFEIISSVISDQFGRKGEEVVKKNIDVARAGYNYAMENNHDFRLDIKPVSEKPKMFLSGNEAIALGAVAAGMKFYSAYPMTPASNILHYFFAKEREFGIMVKQTEDEIAAMNYAVGASFAGVRSMTGTSGGGFALMTEALGMAALAEAPIVAALVQRVGPSTGMPTWTEQADLRFALHASQGEFLRVILAPGDINESFYLSAEAFNLAEKYQLPVIIISDKFLAETGFSAERFDQDKVKIERGLIVDEPPELEPKTRFKRYELTKDGISPRVFPGTPNGIHIGTSYEHDETGFSSESFIMRTKQVDKRASKLKGLLRDVPGPKRYGKKDAQVSLMCWGSQKLPALDSLKILEEEGISANLIHFPCVYPLDKSKLQKALGNSKTILLENNSTGQFAGILKEHCDFEPDFMILKYDGRQFFCEQIVEQVKALASKKFEGKKEIRIHEKEDLEYYNPQRHGL